MTPLNLEQTLSYLRERMPAPFDLPQLAHLCRTGQLTPLFAYDGNVISYYEYMELKTPPATFHLSGYLTAPELVAVVDNEKSLTVDRGNIYEYTGSKNPHLTNDTRQAYKGDLIILVSSEFNFDKYQNDDKYSIFSDNDSVTITRNDLLFDLEQLDSIAPAGYTQSQADKPKPLPVIGEYTTPAMQAMNAVINEFWTDYTPDKIPPKQENVINWIIENYGFSRNLSLAIEQVARPESAKTGGNKAV